MTVEQRLNCPISSAELERRWAAVRRAMAAHNIDVLLMQNTNDFLGGYVKWFTDLPATTGYPVIVIFPRSEPMTYISQGHFGLDRRIAPEGAQQYRGVGRIMGAPGYASARYTAAYEADAADEAMKPFAGSTVGLVGSSHSATLLDRLRSGSLKAARLVDTSDLVDSIKAVKSAEEIAMIRATARMQDACIQAVVEAIRPGMRDIEVGLLAEDVGRRQGSEQGIFLVASGPPGTAATYGIRHYQNRTIERGDVVNLLVENSGPGGMYTEIGRTFVLGKATTEMKDDFAFVRDAQAFTARLLAKHGSPTEIWESYNRHLEKHDKPKEARLHCHSQGYDLVERPLVRHDEPMAVAANMNFACHPTTITATSFASCCDNYLLHQDRAERLHTFPQEIIEIT